MPYVVRKQKTRGYKVCKRGTRKCFSKRPLTKYVATRQMRALYLHERMDLAMQSLSRADKHSF